MLGKVRYLLPFCFLASVSPLSVYGMEPNDELGPPSFFALVISAYPEKTDDPTQFKDNPGYWGKFDEEWKKRFIENKIIYGIRKKNYKNALVAYTQNPTSASEKTLKTSSLLYRAICKEAICRHGLLKPMDHKLKANNDDNGQESEIEPFPSIKLLKSIQEQQSRLHKEKNELINPKPKPKPKPRMGYSPAVQQKMDELAKSRTETQEKRLSSEEQAAPNAPTVQSLQQQINTLEEKYWQDICFEFTTIEKDFLLIKQMPEENKSKEDEKTETLLAKKRKFREENIQQILKHPIECASFFYQATRFLSRLEKNNNDGEDFSVRATSQQKKLFSTKKPFLLVQQKRVLSLEEQEILAILKSPPPQTMEKEETTIKPNEMSEIMLQEKIQEIKKEMTFWDYYQLDIDPQTQERRTKIVIISNDLFITVKSNFPFRKALFPGNTYEEEFPKFMKNIKLEEVGSYIKAHLDTLLESLPPAIPSIDINFFELRDHRRKMKEVLSNLPCEKEIKKRYKHNLNQCKKAYNTNLQEWITLSNKIETLIKKNIENQSLLEKEPSANSTEDEPPVPAVAPADTPVASAPVPAPTPQRRKGERNLSGLGLSNADFFDASGKEKMRQSSITNRWIPVLGEYTCLNLSNNKLQDIPGKVPKVPAQYDTEKIYYTSSLFSTSRTSTTSMSPYASAPVLPTISNPCLNPSFFSGLIELNVEENRLTSLNILYTDKTVRYPHLQVLNAASNPLKEFGFLQAYTSLTSLKLAHVSNLPFTANFAKLVNLTDLDVSFTPWRETLNLTACKLLTSLNVESIESHDKQVFSNLKNLTYLNISKNVQMFAGNHPLNYLINLTHLKTLEMRNNGLDNGTAKLTNGFPLTQITALDLRDNPDITVEGILSFYPNAAIQIGLTGDNNITKSTDLRRAQQRLASRDNRQ